ncbi:sensor histidine kinase [Nibrella viscosa]|uniref:histidine kinase n=1 Tax=Nibrella viscosa TaxID=1084524 RepID=A0ABP8K175_9BACT
MKTLSPLLLLSLTLLLVCSCVESQAQPEFRFEHISTEQGLPQRSVWSLYQDREGFMWFGTINGLVRYDGYQFTGFKPDPRNPTRTLRHNIITAITEDLKGRLWVATLGGGLHQVDKRTGEVIAYPIRPTSTVVWNVLSSVYADKQGHIWTSNQGLARFNPDTKQYKLFPASDLLRQVGSDPQGRIWAGSRDGKVACLDPTTGKYRFFPLPSPKTVRGYIDHKGILWIGTKGEGLFRADTKDDSLRFTPFLVKGVVGKEVNYGFIGEDTSGFLWALTEDKVLRIDPTTGEAINVAPDPVRTGELGQMTFTGMLFDQTGNLWISTYNGVYRVTAHRKAFQAYQVKPTPPSVQLPDNRVTSLLADHTGALWLATSGNAQVGRTKGFYHADAIGKPLKKIWINPTDTSNLAANLVRGLLEDRQGQVWAATPDGLHLYNRTTGQFRHFPTQEPVKQCRMVEDSNGKIWFSVGAAGDKGGIGSFSPASQSFSYYLYKPGQPGGLKDANIYDLMISRENEIWVATTGGGLARLNQQTGKFYCYEASPTFKSGYLNDKDTRALYEDAAGIIWVGTNQGGVHRLDPQTGRITFISTHDGLPSNHIASLTGDDRGNLWIGTDKGLCRFNPKTRTFHTYGIHDGLPDDEFTLGAHQKYQDKLLFGTLNGYVMFNPDSIRHNTAVPPVYITGLKVLDKPRPILSDHLELPYTDNYLSFEFVALNYNAPEKNQYAYKLEGVDKDWVFSGTRRFISYTELRPGDYVFRVKASNNDGVWNEKGTTLYIAIRPPWWRTWWAYSLYVVGFVAGLWAFIQYRSRALRRENRLLEQKVALRTEQIQHQKEEIEAQRDNLEQTLQELKSTQQQLIQKEKMASLGELTAGIAHEIQNPLNFVNNFAEVSVEMADELLESVDKEDISSIRDLSAELKENMSYIAENGQRAAAIVRSMLEHSRSSTGERRPTNLNELADEYLKLAYHGMRAQDPDFQVQLCTQFDGELKPVTIAPQDMGRVLLNLYNNAFYAVRQKQRQIPKMVAGTGEEAESDYQPTVWVSTRQVNGLLELRVKDNGTGIPESIRDKVFQPFFTTKPTGQGTGLGLSLSYDIITKGHGGEMAIESQEGKYATLVVCLPQCS